MKKTITLFMSIFLIFLLVGCERKVDPIPTQTPTNVPLVPTEIVNNGLAVLYGDRIYFQLGGIYSIKIDGSDIRLLSPRTIHVDGADKIYIVDDRIYYTDDRICSMKLDGSDWRALSDYGVFGDGFSIENGIIYYVYYERYYDYKYNVPDGTYSMKLDGSNKRKISDEKFNDLRVVENRIYYNDYSKGLCSIKINGSEKRIISDDHFYGFKVVDDRIYYAHTFPDNHVTMQIRSTKLDGTDKQDLTDNQVNFGFKVSGGRIYYRSHEKLYSMKTDGSDKRKVSDIDRTPIFVAGDKIYFKDGGGVLLRINIDGSDVQQTISIPR